MQTETHGAHPRDGTHCKQAVLVVEDESMIRLVVADRLQDDGFSVLEAADVSEAIEVLETGAPIDAVFSDIHMPGDLTGLDLAYWLREHRPQTPILLASANANTLEICDARDDFEMFAKPYDVSEIAARIRVLIMSRKPPARVRVPKQRGIGARDPHEGARQADRMRNSYLGLARALRAYQRGCKRPR